MANRYFRQFVNTTEPVIVQLYARITFGATGAPTLVAASSKGIRSVTRNSAGVYTIVMGNAATIDTYKQLMFIKHVFDESSNSGTAPTAPGMYILANNVAAAAGSIQIEFNSAGTATDPASTEAVYLEITLKNSTAY